MTPDVLVMSKAALHAALWKKKREGGLKRLRRIPRRASPRKFDAELYRLIARRIALVQELIGGLVIPALHVIVSSEAAEIRHRLDANSRLEGLLADVKARAELVSERAGLRMVATNVVASSKRRITDTIVNTFGIQPAMSDAWREPMIKRFADDASKLITKVSNDFVDRLGSRIQSAVSQGRQAAEIAVDVAQNFFEQGAEAEAALNRARFVARDQIGNLFGSVARIEQTQLGVERYVWRTSQDERVRPTHRARDGETFDWGSGIEEQLRSKGLMVDRIDGPPGIPPNCRCVAEPVLSDLVDDIPAP